MIVVQPQTGIAMPENNGDTMEEVPGANGRTRRNSFLPDGLTKGVWIVKIVSSARPCIQGLSYNGDEIDLHRATG